MGGYSTFAIKNEIPATHLAIKFAIWQQPNVGRGARSVAVPGTCFEYSKIRFL